MNSLKKVLVVLISFLIASPLVKAECDATEENRLRSLAINVKTSYEPGQGEELSHEDFNPPSGLTEEEIEELYKIPVYKSVYHVYITNITEELYVTVYDEIQDKTTTYQYSDTDKGTLVIDQEEFEMIDHFTITVYSSDKTQCPDTKLYTTYLTTPKYNQLSNYAICEGAEEFYLCHEYLSVEPNASDDFETLVENFKAGKIDKSGEKKEDEKAKSKTFGDLIKEYKVIIIGVSAFVIIVGATVIIVVKKKRGNRV